MALLWVMSLDLLYALCSSTVVGEDTALYCYHAGVPAPLPSGNNPTFAARCHRVWGHHESPRKQVSNNDFYPPDPAGCGQQVFLTVFGKSGRLNVGRVGAEKPTGEEIWSLKYHCRLNQWGMVFLASIFHLLCVLVLVCKNILMLLLQTLASNPSSAPYDGEYWEQGLKLSSPGRARDIWVYRDVKVGRWLEALLGRAS